MRLADGSEEPADQVISAADGHATIYGMLGGRYVGEVHRDLYERAALPLTFLRREHTRAARLSGAA